MSREVSIRQPQSAVPTYSLADKLEMAKTVAASRLFPGVDNPAAAMTLMLLCESDGLHPIEAMRRYHIIHNRPSMRADAMQAAFQANGGRVEWVSSTDQECHAVFRHPVHAPDGFPVHVTLKELFDRGVAGSNPIYKKFPRQMLRARAISEGVRAVYPGICTGIYTPEEVADFDPPPPAKVIDVRPAASPEAEAVADGLMEQFDAPTPPARDRRNPKERHPAPAEVAAEMDRHDRRSYRDAIAAVVAGADAEWKGWCESMGIEFEPVVNAFQVENHLVSRALEKGSIKPEDVERDGKRDREMAASALARIYRKHPEPFAAQVAAYVAGKLAEKRKAAEEYLSGPAAEEQSQEPSIDAEAAVEVVAEVVA
jgi:hypothetical protein